MHPNPNHLLHLCDKKMKFSYSFIFLAMVLTVKSQPIGDNSLKIPSFKTHRDEISNQLKYSPEIRSFKTYYKQNTYQQSNWPEVQSLKILLEHISNQYQLKSLRTVRCTVNIKNFSLKDYRAHLKWVKEVIVVFKITNVSTEDNTYNDSVRKNQLDKLVKSIDNILFDMNELLYNEEEKAPYEEENKLPQLEVPKVGDLTKSFFVYDKIMCYFKQFIQELTIKIS